MCLYAHQHFLESEVTFGMYVSVDCPSEEGPALIQKLVLKNLMDFVFVTVVIQIV